MKRTRIISKGLVLLGSLLAASITLAADLPAWYPQEIPNAGVVTSLQGNTLVIRGEPYTLPRGVKIMSPTSRNEDRGRLQQGELVGFELRGDGTPRNPRSKGTISKIWLLSGGDAATAELPL